MTRGPVETIKALDTFWSEGRFDELGELLADDVVVVGSHGNRFTGREAVLNGYRDFRRLAEVKHFAPTNYLATIHSDAAVVEYEWTMQWVMSGKTHDARGKEILALTRDSGAWLIIWRTQIHLPA